MIRLCAKIVADTDLYETDKEVQNLIDWVCLSEQIKENNNTIRNLTGEYKKIEPKCREGVRARLERMKELCIYLGCLMWKKEKITLLHSYHYDKVSPSDKKVFCKISGWGVIFIGIGLLVTAIIIGITDSALSFIAFALGFVVGLALLIYAGTKYNR